MSPIVALILAAVPVAVLYIVLEYKKAPKLLDIKQSIQEDMEIHEFIEACAEEKAAKYVSELRAELENDIFDLALLTQNSAESLLDSAKHLTSVLIEHEVYKSTAERAKLLQEENALRVSADNLNKLMEDLQKYGKEKPEGGV